MSTAVGLPIREELPAPGTAMRVGLPFALNHINLWLLRDEMEDLTQSGHTLQG